jgi:hypothetical protein
VQVPTLPVRTVRGIVRDAAGKPAARAMVLVQPAGSQSLAECVDRTTTDAEGRFAFADVVPGRASVRAWLPGNTVAQCPVEPVEGEASVELQLDGEPERKVRVELRGATPEQRQGCVFRLRATDRDDYAALPRPFERFQPDANGTAELSGMPAMLRGRFVTAEVPGVLASPMRDIVPKGPPEWTVHFDVLPAGEGLIRGEIADRSGNPVAGKRVVCRPLDPHLHVGDATSSVTDGKGRFAVPAPVAESERFALRLVDEALVLDCERRDQLYSRAFYVTVHHPARVHTMTAIPAVRFQVRLLDPHGLPARAAEVCLVCPAGELGAGWNNQLVRAGGLGAGSDNWKDDDEWQLLGLGGTDAEGRCRLCGLNLPEGEVGLWVSTGGGFRKLGPFTVTRPQGLIDLGTVTLTADETARK